MGLAIAFQFINNAKDCNKNLKTTHKNNFKKCFIKRINKDSN